MIVIDFDLVRSRMPAKSFVCSMVASELEPFLDSKGEKYFRAKVPIYWYSKKKITMQDVSAEGFPGIGTPATGNSIMELLLFMIKNIDDFAANIGMKKMGKFRNPVSVVCGSDFDEIEKIGARPIPVALFGLMAGG